MKKSILAIAVLAATTMAATAAVAAPTVYGNVHVSIDTYDKSDGTGAGTNGDPNMVSQTSAFGIKGSEDLGDGLKAIYKLEWQVDVADGGVRIDGSTEGGNAGLIKRDQFVGLKGGWGTAQVGTMSTNYKEKGGQVDALYRTEIEGRGFMNTQSQLHNGRSLQRGRMTNLAKYTSPKMAGIQIVLDTTFSDSENEAFGAGARWTNKSFLVFIDYIDQVPFGPVAIAKQLQARTTDTTSAVKVGGKYTAKAWFLGGQYEDAQDVTDFDYVHVNGGWNINKNNTLILTVGEKSHVDNSLEDTQSVMVAYNHKLSKMTNVYVGYGDKSSDKADNEDSVFTLGIRKKF